MNYYFLIASALCLYGIYIHLKVGNVRIDNVIFATNAPLEVRTISRIVWHSVTMILAISFVALFYGAFFDISRDLQLFIAAFGLGFAGLFLYFCNRHLQNPIRFPHPFFFSLLAIITFFGGLFG